MPLSVKTGVSMIVQTVHISIKSQVPLFWIMYIHVPSDLIYAQSMFGSPDFGFIDHLEYVNGVREPFLLTSYQVRLIRFIPNHTSVPQFLYGVCPHLHNLDVFQLLS